MTRVRTKLVILFAIVALLPALPLSILIKNMLDKTLEVGVNPRVSDALESAVAITKQNYQRHWQEVEKAAETLGKLAERKSRLSKSDLLEARVSMAEVFLLNGELKYSVVIDTAFATHETDGKTIIALSPDQTVQLLSDEPNPANIQAVSPINLSSEQGFLVITRHLPTDFVTSANNLKEVLQIFRSIDFVRGDLRRGFILAFVIVYLPVLALFVGIALLFSNRITTRIEDLAAATQIVAAGDLSHRLNVSAKDEIGQLARSFNQMVSDLQNQQEKLVYLEKMAAWREIARVLAHEIKNPLTPIQLMVQQLRDKYPGQKYEYNRILIECTDIINDEVKNLRSLAQEFSDFARMPELKPQVGNLNELLGEVAKLYSACTIDLQIDSSLPELAYDLDGLRRSLINILDNAFTATGQTGRIEVRSRKLTNFAEVSIWNAGPAISKANLKKIFEPYFSTKHGGIGLGLSVVKHVIEEHGGSITAQNIRGGVEFRLTLPLQTK